MGASPSTQRTECTNQHTDSSPHFDTLGTDGPAAWPVESDPEDSGEEEEGEEESARDEAVTCITCCTEAAIPADPIASGCGHERRICAECVLRHIREELRGKGQVTRIPCPMVAGGECGAILEFQDVQCQASPEDFEFYDRLLTTRALEAMSEFIWCAASGCGSGQLHPSMRRYPSVRCHSCGNYTCFTHRCAWHTGRSCAQYDADARQSEEVALLQALERNDIKRCPRCQHGIEKNAGCDHMTCRTSAGGCGYEFCWLCLADYAAIRQEGNAAHKPTCRYHC